MNGQWSREDADERKAEPRNEGRDDYEMDIDRMVNEGLGGGHVTMQNGLIDETTTDTMDSLCREEE